MDNICKNIPPCHPPSLTIRTRLFKDANSAEKKTPRISRREFGIDVTVAATAAALSLSPPSLLTARRGRAGASERELGIRKCARSIVFTYKADTPKNEPAALTFIPLYTWANRDATPMQMWTQLLRARDLAAIQGRNPGGDCLLITARRRAERRQVLAATAKRGAKDFHACPPPR